MQFSLQDFETLDSLLEQAELTPAESRKLDILAARLASVESSPAKTRAFRQSLENSVKL